MPESNDLAADLAVLGHVVTSTTQHPRGEVRVRDGRIITVAATSSEAPAEQRVDVGEAYVMPGVIDPVRVENTSVQVNGFR